MLDPEKPDRKRLCAEKYKKRLIAFLAMGANKKGCILISLISDSCN